MKDNKVADLMLGNRIVAIYEDIFKYIFYAKLRTLKSVENIFKSVQKLMKGMKIGRLTILDAE